jgi:hypothetical protein
MVKSLSHKINKYKIIKSTVNSIFSAQNKSTEKTRKWGTERDLKEEVYLLCNI